MHLCQVSKNIIFLFSKLFIVLCSLTLTLWFFHQLGGGHPLLNALRRKLVALLHRDVLSEQIRLKLPVRCFCFLFVFVRMVLCNMIENSLRVHCQLPMNIEH